MLKKILVIDDEVLNRELLRSYLEMEGYHVLEAINATQGRKLLQEENPDLILLDVMMPGEDGFSLCQYVKENRQEPFLAVILVTALHDKENRIKGLSVGADDFLSKPIDRVELMIKVRNMLKIRELHQNLYHELVFARQVQESLFLDHSSLSEGDFLLYQPYRQVSGDLIELWEKPGERWGFLADSTGHGPSAALISVAVKALLNKENFSPATLLEELNRRLFDLLTNNDLSYYVTGICVTATENELFFAGAGHPSGYLKSGKTVTPLISKNLPLGILKNQVFSEDSIIFEQGDLLFLYSDGLLDIFEEEELGTFLSERTSPREIYRDLEFLISKTHPRDDLSILAIPL